MQTLKINPQSINKAVEYLKQGGVVIHPTDTCYGLAADITNPDAVRKVYDLKQMSQEKPMSFLVNTTAMFGRFGMTDNLTLALIQKYLPGALTLIVSKHKSFPTHYAPSTDYVGIRIPNHSLSLELAQKLGTPLTTTSANLTGKMQAYTPEEVALFFGNTEVCFLDGGILPKKKPSTILKIADGHAKLIRQGDLVLGDLTENFQ